jgi:DNA-binding response OmpR family regulator
MTPHRILVVDDEPLNVELLDQELSDLGYQVVKATNGQEALTSVAASPPDLILLDVLMPGIDGIEVCRRLKDDPTTRLIPVVIMTALSDREDRIRGVEAGADDFLTKPVDERELHARIRSALRSKAAIDEKLGELESATEQIEALGAHDEDVTVVIASDTGTAGVTRFLKAIEANDGTIATTSKSAAAAVFRGADPGTRLRSAMHTVLGLDERPMSFGIASGSALLGAARVGVDGTARWVLSIAGPAVAAAERAAGVGEAGQVLVGTTELDQLGTGFGGPTVTVADGEPLYDIASSGATDSTLPVLGFPAEFAELLPMLLERWKVDDLYITRILSGKSGARVLMVDIESAGFSGQAILKLEEPEDAPLDGESEAARHELAIAHDPSYADAHLPRLLEVLHHEDRTATLSTVVAGGLEYCTVWFHIPYESQRQAARRVSLDILEGWNADYRLAPGLVEPRRLLASWLQERIEPGESRLDALLAESFGIDAAEHTVIVNGLWYPNPVAFARTDEHGAPPLRAVVGQMHGDLHGHNLLTSHRRGDVSDYYMIDLAFYDDENYLFFDHAYFELSYLLRAREDASPSRWSELLEGVFGDEAVNADDIGILRIVDAIREGQRVWIADHEENRRSYMASQMLLAEVAAGLRLANMRTSLATKILAYLYAAFALKEYVALHEIEWPRSGAVAEIDM